MTRTTAALGGAIALLALGLTIAPSVARSGAASPEAAERASPPTAGPALVQQAAEPEQSAQAAEPRAEGGPVRLPEDIVWETNLEDPPIGSPNAIRGGTFNYYMDAYPLTFRLYGPNSNDAFAGWNRAFTFNYTLVKRHPTTDNYIPYLASHWAVMPDQRTIYFRLDPDARWSDGEPITADDYVFTLEMFKSPHIVDPFYNTYAQEYYESIDAIDDYTLRIVGTRPSWRPLYDYAELFPSPRHATVLDETWVERTTNEPQVAIGPYVISEVSRGESVTFERIDDWWGDNKPYMQGLNNFDRIHLRVIPDERSLDFLRRGEIDLMVEGTAKTWNEEYTFPAVRNGWIRRARVFLDSPGGMNGLQMNLEAPIFQNKDLRKAMQYLFNFERLNRNLMYNEYFRMSSFFEGTEFASPNVRAYPFDPQRARQHLEAAGYRRPDDLRGGGWLARIWNMLRGLIFTRTDNDDVLVNDQGQKASFTLIYGSRGLERHLTVMQQEYRRAGVDMKLRLLEPGTAFERGLERKYEMTLTGRVGGFYPDPRQYFHTTFRDTIQNNNIWGFGTEEVDSLIQVYEQGATAEERITAMHRIDEIVHEEAFYIPFWSSPYIRLVYWDYLKFPDTYLPKRTQGFSDWLVFWYDPEAKEALDAAMAANQPLPLDEEMDKDPYGIRTRFQ